MGQPAALKLTPEKLNAKIDAYFAKCEASTEVRELKSGDKKVYCTWPTMVGLANYLGITKETLYEYMAGNYPTTWLSETKLTDGIKLRDYIARELKGDKHSLTRSYSYALARARQRSEEFVLDAALKGWVEPRIAQLLLNQWGYVSKQEVDNSNVKITLQGMSTDEVKRFSK